MATLSYREQKVSSPKEVLCQTFNQLFASVLKYKELQKDYKLFLQNNIKPIELSAIPQIL